MWNESRCTCDVRHVPATPSQPSLASGWDCCCCGGVVSGRVGGTGRCEGGTIRGILGAIVGMLCEHDKLARETREPKGGKSAARLAVDEMGARDPMPTVPSRVSLGSRLVT